jgi:hypothetical protein
MPTIIYNGRRVWRIAGRSLTKFAAGDRIHVADADTAFEQGERSWESRMLCGRSATGVVVTRPKVNCAGCRKAVERLQRGSS